MAKKSPEELIREMKVEAGGGGRVGDDPPAGVTPKEPLFQAKNHLELEYLQKRANEEPWITERRKQAGGFTDEEERFLVDSAPRRAEAQKSRAPAKRRAPELTQQEQELKLSRMIVRSVVVASFSLIRRAACWGLRPCLVACLPRVYRVTVLRRRCVIGIGAAMLVGRALRCVRWLTLCVVLGRVMIPST